MPRFWLLLIAFRGLSNARNAKWPCQLGFLEVKFCRQEAFNPITMLFVAHTSPVLIPKNHSKSNQTTVDM